MIPLPLYLAIVLCTVFSILFEILNAVLTQDFNAILIIIRILLHISIHMIGAHIMIMSQVNYSFKIFLKGFCFVNYYGLILR